jgi:hypothetical protein
VRPCEHWLDEDDNLDTEDREQCGQPATHEHFIHEDEIMAVCDEHAKDCDGCKPMAMPKRSAAK